MPHLQALLYLYPLLNGLVLHVSLDEPALLVVLLLLVLWNAAQDLVTAVQQPLRRRSTGSFSLG